ncbi:glycosyltransferase family 4 protein [Peribacillus butanolivorans]|uniref:glycosyltransferase family 4 protein n=1 Tax=Peribacillus butanolivorans TaxID=421767 RepID=UPI003D2BB7E6
MKKVFIIHHSGNIGGAGVSLFHIVNSIKSMREKYTVEVYCPSSPPSICDWLEANNIKVIKAQSTPILFNHYNGCNKFVLGRFSLKNIKDIAAKKGWQEIKNAIEISKPDIVAVNSMTLCWMGSLIKEMGIKVICFHRETYAKGLFGVRSEYIKKCLKRNFDGVCFISNHDSEVSGELSGIGEVITDKVDLDLYKFKDKKELRGKLGINIKSFNIAYVGGISKLKGAHVIIKALANIKNDNIRVVFLQYNSQKRLKTIKDCKNLYHKIKFAIGFDYEANLLKLIDRHNLWHRIDFFPPVTNPEKYILASDIVVFPSIKPHQARPIYEAGAARKPIIITNFNQTSEFTKDGFNCLTFSKENYIELSKKINILNKNKDLYNRLLQNNYKQTIKNHNLLNLPMELDEFFTKI